VDNMNKCSPALAGRSGWYEQVFTCSNWTECMIWASIYLLRMDGMDNMNKCLTALAGRSRWYEQVFTCSGWMEWIIWTSIYLLWLDRMDNMNKCSPALAGRSRWYEQVFTCSGWTEWTTWTSVYLLWLDGVDNMNKSCETSQDQLSDWRRRGHRPRVQCSQWHCMQQHVHSCRTYNLLCILLPITTLQIVLIFKKHINEPISGKKHTLDIGSFHLLAQSFAETISEF